jgi:V8-like Glu-specific endopeptidase
VLEGPPPGGRAEAAAPTRPALHEEFSRFEVTDTTSFPNRTHGRVFFTLPGEGDFTCSGTVVTANSHSVVLTAGHCVHAGGPGGGFATNWIFVPGYRDGARPFGEWPAASLAATTGWVGAANLSFDVGAAVVPRIATGEGIQDVVGARGSHSIVPATSSTVRSATRPANRRWGSTVSASSRAIPATAGTTRTPRRRRRW